MHKKTHLRYQAPRSHSSNLLSWHYIATDEQEQELPWEGLSSLDQRFSAEQSVLLTSSACASRYSLLGPLCVCGNAM